MYTKVFEGILQKTILKNLYTGLKSKWIAKGSEDQGKV